MPAIPGDTLDPHPATFAPAPDFGPWLQDTFIQAASPLFNHEHAHLQLATIGVLFTNVAKTRRGRSVLAQAELGSPNERDTWKTAEREMLRKEWFGEIPDFLMTIHAPSFAAMDAWSQCAVLEHELYHMAQQVDQYGAPKFSRTTGLPVWRIVGHDVEEFVGVVRRYGIHSDTLKQLVDVANRGATLQRAKVEGICGTCATK